MTHHLGDKIDKLTIVTTYQSPVQHIPKHLSPQTPLSPTEDYKKAFQNAIQDDTDNDHISKYLWLPLLISISIFIICIIMAIIALIYNNINTLFTSPTMIITSLCGLILAYSYKINLTKIQKLSKSKQKMNGMSDFVGDNESGSKLPSLLEAFRRGDFHKQLAICSVDDIEELLPVVVHSLCQLPFGLTQIRSNLLLILAQRISNNANLDQSFRFFLNCNRDIPSVMKYWENHQYLKAEISLKSEENEDEEKAKGIENESKWSSDPVTFFRSLFKDLQKNRDCKSVSAKEFIVDPISGNLLSEVQLRKIMPSNAKPYLIDCYTFDHSTKSTVLSSKLLLKQGDDLRKDLGVMLMFKMFNELWRENEINHNGNQCETLVYNVVPMAVDFGCIEFIENATKIANIDVMMKQHEQENKNEVIDKLIATAAASYVASYVCGVRDRHHDNILVTKHGVLFNIDFSYILGERLNGLDANLIAIPSKMVKVLGNENWMRFLEVAVLCFNVLRRSYVEILDYSRLCFAFMDKTIEDNEKYLQQSLMIDMEDTIALKRIRELFEKAPSRVSTKMKNAIHSLAVRRKSKQIATTLSEI